VSADPNPPSPGPAPSEEYPIDYQNDDPFGTGRSAPKAASHGKLPAPAGGEKSWPKPVAAGRAGDFWALVGCNAIVFVASVCIMVLELTASRLIARYVGNSLYTWTSVIGVVLAGISIGNYLGGWLADRFAPHRVLPWLFIASGALTFSVLLLNNWAARTERPGEMNWQLWVMLVVAWVFFLPALSLGTISPVTASMALARSAKTGITVGNIYAWGALGSIVGTFLTGFWLIGEFGSPQVIWMTAATLVFMGFLVAVGQRVLRTVALVAVLPLIIQFGLLSSTTAERMGAFARRVAGIRSGWRTTDADFKADREAVSAAHAKHDDAALLIAESQNTWRAERKRAENDWFQWGEKLGGQLRGVGLTLGLRRDDPNEYLHESDYYAIKIADGFEKGDKIKVLTLDHLIHSYWNPDQPAKLYYDYELVYAAVTERAAAMSGRVTQVPLENVPAIDEFVAAFPPSVQYDPRIKMLSIRGAMQFGELRKLLTIGPNSELWGALFSLWDQAVRDWARASQRQGGILLGELATLPEGVSLPPRSGTKVYFDRVLNSLVCTGPFGLAELIDLLAQGEFQEYVTAVRDLFEKSRQVSTLFIGGGGFVFPRWVEQSFPWQPVIDVAEIDPAVKAAVESELGLPAEYGPPEEGKTLVHTHIGDARKFVDDRIRENRQRLAAGQTEMTYDFVYGDAFNDLSVPWHLTTAEFSEKIGRLLSPGRGVYLVNIIDIYPRAQFPDQRAVASETTESPYLTRLPEALLPDDISEGDYVACREPCERLLVMQHRDGSYSLAWRGVMQTEMRDRLLQQATGDEQFQLAIRSLFRQSHEQSVGKFLGRYVNTCVTWTRSAAETTGARVPVFPYVYVFTSNGGDPGTQRDTFVVACSLRKLDFENLYYSGGYWSNGPFAWSERSDDGKLRMFGEMPAVLELARGKLLTDDFAPVDNLLAPVFVNRSED
jgi:hypothetical protein